MKRFPKIALALALATQTLALSAAKIGDPAAALQIKDWVKGSAVDVRDGKNIYVVEFWATWCGPCKQTIPHLTELQKTYKSKGVVFVGVSDEKASVVKPFVSKMADKMDYVVGCDKDGKTSEAYMEAYGQGGIPTAFVVNKESKVVWVGHPMDGLDTVLEQLVAGKFDVAAAVKRDEGRALMADYSKLAASGDDKAKEVGAKLLTLLGNDVDALCDFAFGIVANDQSLKRDFALAESALDTAEKQAGKTDHRVLGVRSIARFEEGKQDEGLALAKAAGEATKDQAMKNRYESFARVMKAKMEREKKKDAAPAK